MSCNPNFDSYMIDSCARYGILSGDPCLYLTGKPSPYLQQYYPAMTPIQDAYVPSYVQPQTDSRGWKKKALALLTLAVATTLAIRHPQMAKKLIPQKVRTFAVNKTPQCVKNFFTKSADFVKDTYRFVADKFKTLTK